MPEAPTPLPEVAIALNGEAVIARGDGALHWPARRTLIVADLHLEKGSAFAARGAMLPPYDSRATLTKLGNALTPHIERVICLGDSFHDGDAANRLDAVERVMLAELTARHEFIWVAGNHDPVPPAGIGGTAIAGTLRLGALTFRHAAERDREAGEISGHYHPKVTLDRGRSSFSAPCFIHDAQRLILPAFGAYAGGLDIGAPALRAIFPARFGVAILMRGRVAHLPNLRRKPPIEAIDG